MIGLVTNRTDSYAVQYSHAVQLDDTQLPSRNSTVMLPPLREYLITVSTVMLPFAMQAASVAELTSAYTVLLTM